LQISDQLIDETSLHINVIMKIFMHWNAQVIWCKIRRQWCGTRWKTDRRCL